jgi:hypothetical protein
MQSPTHPDVLIPHLNPRKDTGPFVQALLLLPPASTVMAASEWLTWPQWIDIWGEVTSMKTSYKQVTVDDLDKDIPGGVGREIGEMYEFSSEFGYNAEQKNTLKIWDLEKVRGHWISTMGFVVMVANNLRRWVSRYNSSIASEWDSDVVGLLVILQGKGTVRSKNTEEGFMYSQLTSHHR